MIIIKGTKNADCLDKINGADIDLIAKFMINYMMGLKTFNDKGEYTGSNEKFPVFHTAHGDLFVKPSCGMVFIPNTFESSMSCDVNRLSSVLFKHIETLEQVFKLGNYLSKYHTIANGLYTCVKAKTESKTRLEIQEKEDHYRTSQNRFTWIINTHQEFKFDIDFNQRFSTIAHHFVSIFYDPYDVVKYKHMQNIMSLTKRDFYASDYITALELFPIFVKNMCLAVELNNRWKQMWDREEKGRKVRRGTAPFNENVLRVLATTDMYVGVLNITGTAVIPHTDNNIHISIPITSVKMKKSSELRNDVCTLCQEILYGKNYAIVDSSGETCRMYCALCTHGCARDLTIENNKSKFVFVVTATRTIQDAIAATNYTPQKKEMMLDVVEHGIKYDNPVPTKKGIAEADTLVGSKYMIAHNAEEFMYTEKALTNRRLLINSSRK